MFLKDLGDLRRSGPASVAPDPVERFGWQAFRLHSPWRWNQRKPDNPDGCDSLLEPAASG
jgi:hypothetical protein